MNNEWTSINIPAHTSCAPTYNISLPPLVHQSTVLSRSNTLLVVAICSTVVWTDNLNYVCPRTIRVHTKPEIQRRPLTNSRKDTIYSYLHLVKYVSTDCSATQLTSQVSKHAKKGQQTRQQNKCEKYRTSRSATT